MIVKTFTYVSFFYKDGDFEFQKKLPDPLAYFCETEQDVNLEVYLKQLLALKPIVNAQKAESIALFHTLFYDDQCNSEFSPAIIELIDKLGATFCITTQKVGEANLYKTLDKLRERPGMYLGEASLTALSNYILGFYEACNYETSEQPPFSGFNDFVGAFYGKHTTAGWKNLILADHYGNETEALSRFFELLDEFRLEEKRPNSRAIIYRLLHVAMLDFRSENEHTRQAQIADMLHHTSLQLHEATFGRLMFWYDNILQDIFERANGNDYLMHWIKANAPSTGFFEYQIRQIDKDNQMVIICDKKMNFKLELESSILKTFFAINDTKADEVKELFLESLSK